MHTHVVGPQVKELVARFRAGDVEGARELDRELAPSIDLLRVVVNPIAIKCALNLLGHEVGGVRLPLVDANDGGARGRARLPRAAGPPAACRRHRWRDSTTCSRRSAPERRSRA